MKPIRDTGQPDPGKRPDPKARVEKLAEGTGSRRFLGSDAATLFAQNSTYPTASTAPTGKKEIPTRLEPIETGRELKSLYHIGTVSSEEQERHLAVLRGAREVGDDKARFWNTLIHFVNKTEFTLPQDRLTQVLVLGCGKCREGKALNNFFGGERIGDNSSRAKVIGIDIDQRAIEEAIEGHKVPDFSKPVTTLFLPSNFEFIHGDATRLDQYEQIPKQVDVVVVRHQQISSSEEIWGSIFEQALERVSPDGIVILTSYSDSEHKMLMKKLATTKHCQIVWNERNPYEKSLDHPEVSADRHVAVVKRTLG